MSICPLPLEPPSYFSSHPTPLGCHRALGLSSLHHTVYYYIILLLFFSVTNPKHVGEILVPRPGIKLVPRALESKQSLSLGHQGSPSPPGLLKTWGSHQGRRGCHSGCRLAQQDRVARGHLHKVVAGKGVLLVCSFNLCVMEYCEVCAGWGGE